MTTISSADLSTNKFRSLLHQTGFKATPARLRLLAILHKTKKPLSIKDMQEVLKRNDMDQATIYRIINSLKNSGIIRRVDLEHGHAHYELASETGHHHHLICEHCGKVVDISKCDMTGVEKQALKIGGFAKINKHSLEFFGLCNSCAKQSKR